MLLTKRRVAVEFFETQKGSKHVSLNVRKAN